MKHTNLAAFSLGAVALGAFACCIPSIDGKAHDRTVAGFEELHRLELARDFELFSLGYGLNRSLDELRRIDAERRPIIKRLLTSAGSGVNPWGPRLELGTQQLVEQIEQKGVFIEDFVTENSLLQHALRSLPVVTDRLTTFEPLDDTELEQLLSEVESTFLRYGLYRDEQSRARSVDAQAALLAEMESLKGARRITVDKVLRHTNHILQNQGPSDQHLRELLDFDTARLVAEVSGSYEAAFDAHRSMVHQARALLVLGALVYGGMLLFSSYRLHRSNVAIEREVRARTKELAASREELRTLLESTSAVPWRYRADRSVLDYVGPQLEDLLGFSLESWTEPGAWEARILNDDREAYGAFIQLLENGDQHAEEEFRMRHADGRIRWVRCIARGGVDGVEDRTFQGFFLDVTKRRELEGELFQAQKLESVGRLAAGVAHEINTPIQFISDNTRFLSESFQELATLLLEVRRLGEEAPIEKAEDLRRLMEEVDLDFLLDEIPEALGQSLEGMGRVAEIVRAMKDFSHPGTGTPVQLDLNRALESTLAVSRNEWKFLADAQLDLEPDLPTVECFPGEVNQVFLNLIVNAAHAIGDARSYGGKGSIWVRTRNLGDFARVEIQDDGGGIPEAIQDQIFDPFFTTKEVGRGTGQGLAISRSVIDKHGGSMRFVSATGIGTTFVIELPFVARQLSA